MKPDPSADGRCRLSERTLALVARVFPQPGRQATAVDALESRCGRGIPFCSEATPESLERIRFAVLKLSGGDLRELEAAIELANIDWRDLLMNADFGRDVHAHQRWADSVLS